MKATEIILIVLIAFLVLVVALFVLVLEIMLTMLTMLMMCDDRMVSATAMMLLEYNPLVLDLLLFAVKICLVVKERDYSCSYLHDVI